VDAAVGTTISKKVLRTAPEKTRGGKEKNGQCGAQFWAGGIGGLGNSELTVGKVLSGKHLQLGERRVTNGDSTLPTSRKHTKRQSTWDQGMVSGVKTHRQNH